MILIDNNSNLQDPAALLSLSDLKEREIQWQKDKLALQQAQAQAQAQAQSQQMEEIRPSQIMMN